MARIHKVTSETIAVASILIFLITHESGHYINIYIYIYTHIMCIIALADSGAHAAVLIVASACNCDGSLDDEEGRHHHHHHQQQHHQQHHQHQQQQQQHHRNDHGHDRRLLLRTVVIAGGEYLVLYDCTVMPGLLMAISLHLQMLLLPYSWQVGLGLATLGFKVRL